jgi:WD40 repeat protein
VILQLPIAADVLVVAGHPGYREQSYKIRPEAKPSVFLELPREVRVKAQLPGSFAAGPTVHENCIYAASRDGVLYRLDPSSKQGLRSFSTTSLSGTLARPLPTPRGVVLTVLEGVVFLIQSADDQLRATWRVDLGENLRVDPVLLDDSVLLTTENGTVFVLSLRDGSVQGRLSHEGHRVIGPPVLAGDRIYVALSGGLVSVYQVSTRKLLTTWNLDQDLAQPLQIAGDQLIAVTVDRQLRLLDASSGETTVRFKVHDLPSATALVEGPQIDLPLGQNLARIDLQTREVVHIWEAGSSLVGSPIRFGDLALASDTDGFTVGLRTSSPEPSFRTRLAHAPAVGGPVKTADGAAVLLFQDGTLCILDL